MPYFILSSNFIVKIEIICGFITNFDDNKNYILIETDNE